MKTLTNKNFYLFLTTVLLIVLFSNTAFLYTDLPLGHPKPWQLGFQLPASPIAHGIFAFRKFFLNLPCVKIEAITTNA